MEKIKSWPSLLAQSLDKKDRCLTLVHNLSVPGDSSGNVIKRFPVEAEARCKRIYPDDRFSIIFAVGINDAKCLEPRGNSVTSEGEFKNNIGLLIENAKKYSNHIIFVGLTPTDERKTAPLDNAYFLNEKIGMYERVIGEECEKRNVLFLNIAKEWLKLDYFRLLSKDGGHLNREGHKKIFEKIKPLFI